MWQQKKIGVFEDNTNIKKIDVVSHGNYILWHNEDYETDFDTLEELESYLKEKGIGEIIYPEITSPDNQWHEFKGNKNYIKVFTQKKDEETICSVMVHRLEEDRYNVYMRETDYSCKECLLEESLNFAEANGKDAKSDLELDAYEITLHGASGMDERHNDLRTLDDVNRVLKEKYGINYAIC